MKTQKVMQNLLLMVAFSAIAASLWARQENDPMLKLSKREREIVRSYERKYLDSVNVRVEKYFGDALVDSGQITSGHVEVINGTLRVRGTVSGTVLALFSDVELDSSAQVQGHLVCVNGKVWRRSGALVRGDLIESFKSTADIKEDERNEEWRDRDGRNRDWSHGFWSTFDEDHDLDGLYIDYNRVDGLTLGLRLPRPDWWERRHKHFGLYGQIGYAFVRDHIQYQLGLERWLFGANWLSVGGEVHDFTDSEDRWIISDEENALAASLMREDFRDYYLRKGYKLYVAHNPLRNLHLRAEYREDDISNLAQIAKWSLFGGDKKFRPNPVIVPEEFILETGKKQMKLSNVWAWSALWDTRDRRDRQTRRGWLVQGYLETGRFGHIKYNDFSRAIIDVRRYQPLGWDENLSIRLRAGTSTGLLPSMYWFDLGGISTLRGDRFKSMTGNRMVLANAEYRINTFASDWFILDDFDLVLFVDSGHAWFTNGLSAEALTGWPLTAEARTAGAGLALDEGFDDLNWNKLKTNVGIGLSSRDGDFRIDFAKPTNHGGKDFIVTMRLQRSF